jgi:tetratricopeptide (TPR) repeat protein
MGAIIMTPVSSIDQGRLCSATEVFAVKLQHLLRLLSAVFALSLFPIAVAQVIDSSSLQPSDNSELHLGAQAIKAARYDEAIQHFERAALADPGKVKPHLYLATAYAQKYIPGADTAENSQSGERAIEQYRKVLDIDSSNMVATKGIAYLYLQTKRFDEAKGYYRRATELDPKDAEAYYSVGVVDWTQTYQPRMELRTKLDMKPDQPLIKRPECWQIREANLSRVSEGMETLKKAIKLRPDYDEAMAYMNLMYRERADIQCGDARANKSDLKTADTWVDKTMAFKKAKAKDKEQPPSDSNQQ